MNLIKGNIFFNGPRAAVNFNDGFGGGTRLTENILFNTCRETSDHGPFNSWDRMPFLTDIRDGTPSYNPADWEIDHNLILSNYESMSAIDNDDGSSFYHIHHNVFPYGGGMKMDFGGHDKKYHDNIVIYIPREGVSYGFRC